MRTQQLNAMPSAKRERGFVLFAVLLVMLVLSGLVLVAVQSFNSERFLSVNDADRKTAAAFAQDALHSGENWVREMNWTQTEFQRLANASCENGLCARASVPAWERKCGANRALLCIQVNGVRVSGNTAALSLQGSQSKSAQENYTPRYVVEWIRETDDERLFRVNAWARGKSGNSAVLLQSYVWTKKAKNVAEAERF